MVIRQSTDYSRSESSRSVPGRTRWDFLHIFDSCNERGSAVLINCLGNARGPLEHPYLPELCQVWAKFTQAQPRGWEEVGGEQRDGGGQHAGGSGAGTAGGMWGHPSPGAVTRWPCPPFGDCWIPPLS